MQKVWLFVRNWTKVQQSHHIDSLPNQSYDISYNWCNFWPNRYQERFLDLNRWSASRFRAGRWREASRRHISWHLSWLWLIFWWFGQELCWLRSLSPSIRQNKWEIEPSLSDISFQLDSLWTELLLWSQRKLLIPLFLWCSLLPRRLTLIFSSNSRNCSRVRTSLGWSLGRDGWIHSCILKLICCLCSKKVVLLHRKVEALTLCKWLP